MDVPTHEDIHGHSQQVKDAAHTCYLGKQIAGRGIEPGPGAKLLLKEGIGRHGAALPIEGHEVLRGEIAGYGYTQREDKGIPVGGKSLARIAYIGDAAHVCGKNAHAHHPARNGVTCRGELVGRAPLSEEAAAEDYHAKGKNQEDDKVYSMHKSGLPLSGLSLDIEFPVFDGQGCQGLTDLLPLWGIELIER